MSESSSLPMGAFAALFETAPHVIVVLDPGLSILVVNEAGRQLLGMETAQLTGMQLFDILPKAVETGTGWQDLLLQSYAKVLTTGARQSLLLPARKGPGAAPGATSEPAPVASAAAADGGIWHVCHAPVHDDDGRLVAIATHALLLDGAAIALARTSAVQSVAPLTPGANRASAVPPATIPARPMPAPAWPAQAGAALHGVPGAIEHAADDSTRQAGAVAANTSMHILMVEDNEDLRTINIDQMEMLGHRVTSAADAEQALRHLETSTFDLLFTDLTLPKMSGAELARLVLQQHHPMRVVITSGYGRALANAQSLDALFLPKPYRFADLQEVLRQVRLRHDG